MKNDNGAANGPLDPITENPDPSHSITGDIDSDDHNIDEVTWAPTSAMPRESGGPSSGSDFSKESVAQWLHLSASDLDDQNKHIVDMEDIDDSVRDASEEPSRNSGQTGIDDTVDVNLKLNAPKTKLAPPQIEEKADFNTYEYVTARHTDFADNVLFDRATMNRAEGDLYSHRHLNAQENKSDHDAVAFIAANLRTNFLFLSLGDNEVIALAKKFEIVVYEVGATIIVQDSQGDSSRKSYDNRHYYILVEGECKVMKDGKQIHGKYGVIEEGTPFGEQAILFDTSRQVTIIASKPPPGKDRIAVFRLKDTHFLGARSEEDIQNLRYRVKEIQGVVNSLSGVDTKLKEGTIIRPYKGSSRWLWRRWSGTILQYVWKDVLGMMVFTAIIGGFFQWVRGSESLEDFEDHIINQFKLIGGWWGLLSPLTTFVSTFFLGEAFKFWNKFYWTSRALQGRFNDISLLLASNARHNTNGDINETALEALDDISRLMTLLHQLHWCSIVGRFKCLLAPEGISYLRSRNLLSKSEYKSMLQMGVKSVGGHHASMTWLTSRISLACKRGEIDLDQPTMITLYVKITDLRALMGRLQDMYDGRMPLAYIHFVHMLVNIFVLLSPISLFEAYSFWSVLIVGLITMFYKGIFVLSKMFLDPVDNDKEHQYGNWQTVGFDVGVLIREATNKGTAYIECAKSLPQY